MFETRTRSTKQTRKQNITRYIEIKNKLTVTRGEGIMRGKGRMFSGTCIQDTWTKPKRGRIKGGKRGWLGWGEVVRRKWRQLYLNNSKKKKK